MREFANRIVIFVFWGFVVFALNKPWGSVPPIGSLLNPFQGVWQNGPIRPEKNLKLKGLIGNVELIRDQYGVPHVFALNDEDLYYSQGYLHAKDRLFQMDLSARAGSGRLSELVGDRASEIDKFFVRIGMREGARNALEGILKSPIASKAVEAYVKGINEYISNLPKKDFPVEYKILNAKPELFTPLHVGNFLMTMSFRLTGKNFDLEINRILKKLGSERTLDLFPNYISNPSLIIEKPDVSNFNGNKAVWNTNFLSRFYEYDPELIKFVGFKNEPDGFNGSNNWAVHKNFTKNKKNIVANDTHLGLTLPSVWYEMQMKSPNQNVYGASFPGAPGIIIGHNNQVAWAVTNATADSMDFFEVKFRNDFSEYFFEGEWRKTKIINEEIIIKGEGVPHKMRTVWTHQGVVIDKKDDEYGLVMAWTPLLESAETEAFLRLNFSSSHEECRQSLKLFHAPAQNFICADRQDISITHNGKIPKRKIGQGRFIMDGSSSDSSWTEFIDFDELPSTINPSQGFVRSANQSAVDDTYPHYLGWYYDDPFRGQRIYDLLKNNRELTVEDMIKFQYDKKDLLAEKALPYFVKSLSGSQLTEDQSKAVEKLKKWNYNVEHDENEPTLFYVWWKHFRNELWKKHLWTDFSSLTPQDNRTLKLIEDVFKKIRGQSFNWQWLEASSQEETEKKLQELIQQSFFSMWKELNERFGLYGNNWNWEYVNVLNLKHVANIPGFESNKYKMGGSAKTVNANKGEHAAAWRMVVELGDEFEMWTNIPGGVSGNPFSPTYQHWLESWTKGEMRKAYYLKDIQSIESQSGEGFQRKITWEPQQ